MTRGEHSVLAGVATPRPCQAGRVSALPDPPAADQGAVPASPARSPRRIRRLGVKLAGISPWHFPQSVVGCRLSAQFVGSVVEEARATCSQHRAVPLGPILNLPLGPTGRTRRDRFSGLPRVLFPQATGWFDREKPESGEPPGWGRFCSVSATCRTGNRPVKVPVGDSPNSPRGATAPLPAKMSRVDSGTRSRPVRSIPLAGATLHHGGSRLPPPPSR